MSNTATITTTHHDLNKNHWENKVKLMEKSKIFLDFFASDLIQRSIDLYFNITTEERNVSILDLATGTGLVPFKFVDEKILPDKIKISALDGIDFAASMIEGAEYKKQSRIEEKQVEFDWDNLKFQVMDGQELKFPDESFDIVYSNMGVMFYPKMVQGLSEIKRVLKKGGMAFVNSWTDDFPNRVSSQALFEVLQQNRPPFALQDPKVFEQRCREAGFEHVEIRQVTQSLKMKYSELQNIFNMGNQFATLVQKYLKENPQVTSTEKELLDRIDQVSRREFNISNNDEEIEIISIANVVILAK
ncbi:methyltransferase type 11 [Naegleria gruberi]|uniref:Methyltransferase type 11 n=1 Tax=Naegleria gruberi TaxID=5762 RepID=D2VF41_NAEGR|nr:methyltransferase type 11 [Naegleria gruberi]EFC44710.1 methyltransferase type 11 [Naegleria gruberi]|eukprot:XP_002677454.1 methyltransferase type 11 [Naegleria gruberi strain NEG-M]